MIRLIITGACGRTGSAILRLAASDADFTVAHIIDHDEIISTCAHLEELKRIHSLHLEKSGDAFTSEEIPVALPPPDNKELVALH